MTEQEQKAFEQMRGALETCTYTSSYDKSFDIVKVEEALTAANAIIADKCFRCSYCGSSEIKLDS